MEKRLRSINISTKRAVSTATRSTVVQNNTVASPSSVHEDVRTFGVCARVQENKWFHIETWHMDLGAYLRLQNSISTSKFWPFSLDPKLSYHSHFDDSPIAHVFFHKNGDLTNPIPGKKVTTPCVQRSREKL